MQADLFHAWAEEVQQDLVAERQERLQAVVAPRGQVDATCARLEVEGHQEALVEPLLEPSHLVPVEGEHG